jgi:hypothetical protein
LIRSERLDDLGAAHGAQIETLIWFATMTARRVRSLGLGSSIATGLVS